MKANLAFQHCFFIIHMGHISRKDIPTETCHFFSKFEHSLLENYKLWGTKFFLQCLSFGLWHLGKLGGRAPETLAAVYLLSIYATMYILIYQGPQLPRGAFYVRKGFKYNIPRCQRPLLRH